MATLVKCLSYLNHIYISFRYRYCRICRAQNERNLLCKDKQWGVGNLCITRRFSYQIFCLQTTGDSRDTFDKQTVQLVCLELQFSIWQYHLFYWRWRYLCPGILMSKLGFIFYRFHNPKTTRVNLMFFELLIKNNVFTGQ